MREDQLAPNSNQESAEAVTDDRDDPRIDGGFVVAPEAAIESECRFDAIYAKEVVEHVLAWPVWLAGLRRLLVPGGKLWLSTPNYGEPWLPGRPLAAGQGLVALVQAGLEQSLGQRVELGLVGPVG